MADPLEAALSDGLLAAPGGRSPQGAGRRQDPILAQQIQQMLAGESDGMPAGETMGETTMFRGSQLGPGGEPELRRPGITPPGPPIEMAPATEPGPLHARIQSALSTMDRRRKILRGLLKLMRDAQQLRAGPAASPLTGL